MRPGPKRLIVLTTNKQSKQCLSSVAGPENKQTNKQQYYKISLEKVCFLNGYLSILASYFVFIKNGKNLPISFKSMYNVEQIHISSAVGQEKAQRLMDGKTASKMHVAPQIIVHC